MVAFLSPNHDEISVPSNKFCQSYLPLGSPCLGKKKRKTNVRLALGKKVQRTAQFRLVNHGQGRLFSEHAKESVPFYIAMIGDICQTLKTSLKGV